MRKALHKNGISLAELAIILVIVALFSGMIISLSQATDGQECLQITQSRLRTIQSSITNFSEANQRLPLPASRILGVEDPNYGRESSGGAIDVINGASYGALPFQALGLPGEYAGDCYHNKFTYIVTTALTTNATSNGFMDGTVKGNLTVRSNTSSNINSNVAYAVISHGEDGLGTVALNYTGTDHSWCTGTDLKSLNCNMGANSPNTTLADATFNNGKDAGAAYFDDVIVYGGKPAWVPTNTAPPNLYAWGSNSNGQLGDGTTSTRLAPKPAKSSLNFSSVTVGSFHSCGLTNTGVAYCWGSGSSGKLGNGGSSDSNVPVAVNTTQTFKSISAGANHTCAIAMSGDIYCWGTNSMGEIGDGSTPPNSSLIPALVAAPSIKFKAISAGSQYTCAISEAGDAYCWGRTGPHLGLGNPPPGFPPPVLAPSQVQTSLKFDSISADFSHTCALSNGDAYCWGEEGNGQLGNNQTAPLYMYTPVAVSTSLKFKQISVGNYHTCAIAADGKAYCWGQNNYGQLGAGSIGAPQLVPVAVSTALLFDSLGGGYYYSCGLSSGRAYCWGWDYLVFGSTSTPLSSNKLPVAVDALPNPISRLAVGWSSAVAATQ